MSPQNVQLPGQAFSFSFPSQPQNAQPTGQAFSFGTSSDKPVNFWFDSAPSNNHPPAFTFGTQQAPPNSPENSDDELDYEIV
jgi:hypothetical protein